MGILTKAVEGKLRNVIPMGRPQQKKNYTGTATFRDIVRDAGMHPDRVEVIADGEDVGLNERLGSREDITILPKQKGGTDNDEDDEE